MQTKTDGPNSRRLFSLLEGPVDRVFHSGEPCNHPCCLGHKTHPCEGCGRVGGKGEVTFFGKSSS